MKRLDQLGISPTPWMTWKSNRKRVKDARAFAIADCDYENSEDVANACLIAAAPDLYEALRMFVELCESYGCDKKCEDCGCAEQQCILKARAALAKASGEEVTP